MGPRGGSSRSTPPRIAVVVETAADEVGEECARVAARCDDRLHRAVLPGQVNGDGGSGSLRSAARRPFTAEPFLSKARGDSGARINAGGAGGYTDRDERNMMSAGVAAGPGLCVSFPETIRSASCSVLTARVGGASSGRATARPALPASESARGPGLHRNRSFGEAARPQGHPDLPVGGLEALEIVGQAIHAAAHGRSQVRIYNIDKQYNPRP